MRGSNFLCQHCGHGCRRGIRQSRRHCSRWVPPAEAVPIRATPFLVVLAVTDMAISGLASQKSFTIWLQTAASSGER